MRFAAIDEHRAQYPLGLMCRVLGVSRSGYHAWRTRPLSSRGEEEWQLVQTIELICRPMKVFRRLRAGNEIVAPLQRFGVRRKKGIIDGHFVTGLREHCSECRAWT